MAEEDDGVAAGRSGTTGAVRHKEEPGESLAGDGAYKGGAAPGSDEAGLSDEYRRR